MLTSLRKSILDQIIGLTVERLFLELTAWSIQLHETVHWF